MATHFELWNDRTNNLIDKFETIEQALDEVRWRTSARFRSYSPMPPEPSKALSVEMNSCAVREK
jgi:hypothetical protein